VTLVPQPTAGSQVETNKTVAAFRCAPAATGAPQLNLFSGSGGRARGRAILAAGQQAKLTNSSIRRPILADVLERIVSGEPKPSTARTPGLELEGCQARIAQAAA